jgi:opacity protein-like surface antigen
MIYKKALVAFAALGTLGICSAAHAELACNVSGVYTGVGVGYGNTDYGTEVRNVYNINGSIEGVSTQIQEDGVAGRAYLGYQFNQYFGVETGYNVFSPTTYSYNGVSAARLKTEAWDVLAKIGTPFGDSGFSGNLKAGVTNVMTNVDRGLLVSSAESAPAYTSGASFNDWDPTAGAGIAYNFNKNLAMDISYLHTFATGGVTTPSTDLVTLGVSYLFA